MSSIYVGKNLRKFESSPQFLGYTKVVLQVSDEIEYVAGTDTGRTLTLVNPWGTQARAEAILDQIKGFTYQPYTASGAIVDAATELGDAVSVNGVYSGVYGLTRRYGGIQFTDLNAPSDEEIDHEYPYKSPQDRRVTRQFREVRASLSIQADRITAEVEERKSKMESVMGELSVQAGQISAKVSKTGGDSESFAWDMQTDHVAFIANNSDVFRVDKTGAEVNGIIRATGGKIGGFDITQDSLSYNNHTWGGTNSTGVYIGPNGIQLGKNFKVDSAGNLTAASGTFTGYVKAGKIQYGDDDGYLPGSGIASHSVYGTQIGYSTISTAHTSPGVNTSLGYANFANDVFNWRATAPYVCCSYVVIGGKRYAPGTIRYKNANDDVTTAKVLLTQD